MAFTANTVKPVRPLRTLFGGMIPIPTKKFPVVDTSRAVYDGNAFIFAVTAVGTVIHADGGSGEGVPGTGIVVAALTGGGLVGFAAGASTGAPPFPTAAGANSGGLLFTTPAAVTDNDPIPEAEKVLLALAMPHVVFRGNLANSSGGAETDFTTTPDRNDIGKIFALSVSLTAGDNAVVFLDHAVTTGNACARPIDFAYPQSVPTARTTTGQTDPWYFVTTRMNPDVEFIIGRSVFSIHV